MPLWWSLVCSLLFFFLVVRDASAQALGPSGHFSAACADLIPPPTDCPDDVPTYNLARSFNASAPSPNSASLWAYGTSALAEWAEFEPAVAFDAHGFSNSPPDNALVSVGRLSQPTAVPVPPSPPLDHWMFLHVGCRRRIGQWCTSDGRRRRKYSARSPRRSGSQARWRVRTLVAWPA